MAFDPTNFTTWTVFSDHPIFGANKSDISAWSRDPSRYCELKAYGEFLPEWYVHVDPALPVDEQRNLANRDIANLASACAEIEKSFGQTEYELVFLDDFTVYIFVQHPRFSVDIYPNNFPDESAILKLIIESQGVELEHDCHSVTDLIDVLHQTIGT